MKVLAAIIISLFLVTALTLTGCGPQKAETSRDAINTAKTMETKQEQVEYLVSQAQAFINSDQFQGAIDIAQYVLQYLDRDSAQARSLLDQAKSALAAQAQKAAEEAKKQFSGFGK